LRACPGVVDAACAARDDRLIAWFVPEEKPGPTIAEFRGWMRDRLPGYMMPALFVPVDALPLTPNGKVDRRSLPDPAGQVPQAAEYEAPEGALETLLAEIWASLLQIERVGAGDYFFELGGHSLLAMQAVAAFEERSGYRLEPRALFFNNVRELAASAAPLPVEQP
ncbi:phosphopantetheine-binding protein, partial [Gemmatimonadota bacterium DH-20]